MAAEFYREIKARAAHCRNCPLWENATQTVFGAGAISTPLMLVGEQPGDKIAVASSPPQVGIACC